MNGLDVGLEEFKNMNRQDKEALIYKNLVHIRYKIGGTKLKNILTFVWLFALSVVFGVRKFLPI